MFRLLKFLVVFAIFAAIVGWIINNNGEVVINWLGYEIVTDVFMIIVIAILVLAIVVTIAYLLTKIFSFKLGSIATKFHNKRRDKKLERMEKNSEVSYLYLTKILAYLDEHDIKLARKFFKQFCALVDNKDIIEYLNFRFYYFESTAYQASQAKKVGGSAPGSSPENEKELSGYFNFASKKGWRDK